MPVWVQIIAALVPALNLAILLGTSIHVVTTLKSMADHAVEALKELVHTSRDHAERIARMETRQMEQDGEISRARDRLDRALDRDIK